MRPAHIITAALAMAFSASFCVHAAESGQPESGQPESGQTGPDQAELSHKRSSPQQQQRAAHLQDGPQPASLPYDSGPYDSAAHDGGVFVDLMAAEFFESRLRLAQSRRIEAETAHMYRSMSAAERARFREVRRQIWRQMSDEARARLRGVKRPRYANLDELQKQTFRRIASEELGAAAPLTSETKGQGDI